MAERSVGEGRVAIELDGKQMALVPSLDACLEISKATGGLAGALQRCQNLHFETIVFIVGEGLEIDGQRLNPRQRADMLPKAIYEAGTVIVAAKCMDFITIIGRGGRPLDIEDDDEGEAGEDGGAPLAR